MQLFFRKFGKGPPLIIVHGLYGSSDNWISIGKSLAENFEVYLPDQRNHGRSPHCDTHNYPAMRDDIAGFMDSQHLEKAILMGHSMGGKTIMHLAVVMPERVESLVIIDIAPLAYTYSDHSSQVITHTRILDSMLAVDFDHVHSREDADRQLARTIYSPRVRSFLLKNIERTGSNRYRWRINASAIRAELPSILDGLDPRVFAAGKGITGFQVLFIRGENSDYIRDDMIPGIKTIFPMAEITTIPGAGHWLHVEQPSLLLKTLKYFLLGEPS